MQIVCKGNEQELKIDLCSIFFSVQVQKLGVGGAMACTEAIRIIFERPHEEKKLIMSSGDSLNPTDFIHITRFVPRMEPSTAPETRPILFQKEPQAP
jgi:hypothetical protein